jgi:plastocyanin
MYWSSFMPTFAPRNVGLAVAAALLITPASLLAAEWGTLTGRFVYGGDAPAAAKLTIDKDVDVCSKFGLVNEDLVVGEGKGVANIVIFVRDKDVDVHPDLKATEPVVLDNLGCRFSPHVVFVQTGQDLIIKNSDPVGHNSNVATLKNPASNTLIPAGGETKVSFRSDEAVPAAVTCNIHPWMKGWVVVRDNPYAAVTGEDGSFTIENLPAGKLELQLWHEKAGYLDTIVINGKKESVKRGRMEVDIKAAGTDLGEMVLDASVFK